MLLGRSERYLELLQRFVDGHRGDLQLMHDSLEAGDGAGLHRLAHNMKGVTATLGADAVCDAATRLDNAVRE